MKTAKKCMACIAAVILVMAMLVISASACSMIYVGSDLTEDGGMYFARSEDLTDANKIFYVAEAGTHKAGEVYTGCDGFTYTFSHDSYAYTAFRDDNLLGTCPDCRGTHDHTPYEEAGTNEKGVSITSTVTLSANRTISGFDPKNPHKADGIIGIEEAEINTILLSEAATAKEALDLLMHIYDTLGTRSGNGIIIADQNEAYYIENTTGTQYIAIKLNPSMVFISPNVSAMGMIDLDDPNVFASENLIAIAQEAGTFVGDADENIIDFKASYSNAGSNARLINGTNYLNKSYDYTSETFNDDVFKISNVNDGEIVPFYTNIQPDHKITTKDMVDFYKVDGIGNTSNLEYHVFQIYSDAAPELATIEWVGMSHGAYGVMVPYYPVITNDTYAAYQLGTAKAVNVEKQPTSGVYYPTSFKQGKTTVQGFKVLPENWSDSFFWSFEAVSKYITYGPVCDEDTALVLSTYADLQQKIYDAFQQDQAAVAELINAGDTQKASTYATEHSAAMAKEAHETAVDLFNAISTFEDVKLMALNVGEGVKVKASGGIAGLEDAEKFLEIGAERLGTSRIVKAVKESEK